MNMPNLLSNGEKQILLSKFVSISSLFSNMSNVNPMPNDTQSAVLSFILVAKRKACLQPEKTQGYQYLFAVQFFNSYVYRGRLVAGLDKVFENRDRHHRIRRQILRQNEGLIWFLAQS